MEFLEPLHRFGEIPSLPFIGPTGLHSQRVGRFAYRERTNARCALSSRRLGSFLPPSAIFPQLTERFRQLLPCPQGYVNVFREGRGVRENDVPLGLFPFIADEYPVGPCRQIAKEIDSIFVRNTSPRKLAK